MDMFLGEQDELASLGLVFFANEFIRALDKYATTGRRPDGLVGACDKAITSLQRLHHPDVGGSSLTGLLTSADEIAILATTTERLYKAKTTEEATNALERIQKAVGKIKTQKELTGDLKEKINEVVQFFECLAEDGLANCQRRSLGDMTEAERIWQHYAMS